MKQNLMKVSSTDNGYKGIDKIHANAELPKKRSKKNSLTKEDKKKI